MRLKALVLSLAAYLLMTMAAQAAVTVPTPLVSLDASALPLGDLLVWYNAGTLGGSFQEIGAPPQVEMVAGRKAVTFSGWNGFRSTFPCPTVLTGPNPFSVSLRGLNNNFNKAGEEWVITWSRNGTAAQVAAVGMGNNVGYGAVHHSGGNNDLGWDRGLPTQGEWHSIIVTFSGISAWERVYLDGILVSVENKAVTLDIQDQGFPFLMGVVDTADSFSQVFVGSVSSVKVWAQELSVDQVLAEYYGTTVPNQAPVVPNVVNGGFEIPLAWSQNTAVADNRSIPGWCINDVSDISNTNRAGIGVCGPNLNLLATGSHWDNGANPQGVSVMSIAGTAAAGQGVSQYFYFYSGRTYRLHFNYNCKTTGAPTMSVRVNGNNLTGSPLTVSACDVAGSFTVPFYEFEATFTVPSNGYYPLEIEESDAGTGNVLLIDDVQLTAANNPNPFVCDQDGGLDFGLVPKSTVVDTSFTIHNLGSATLNFGNNYGAVTNNAGWNISGTDAAAFRFGYWDGNGVYQTYGANSTVFSVPGYETAIRSTMRFQSNTGMKTYNATLNLTWSNGTYAGIRSIPLKATIASQPVVLNGSFELPRAADWNGFPNSCALTPYAYGDYLGDKRAIPNWKLQASDGFWYSMPAHGIGVEDRQNANRFINAGNNPNGRQALYMQTIADQPALLNDGVTANGTVYDAYSPRTRTIRQYLGGFQSGHTYKISLWAGCRNSGASRAAITVALDNIQLTATNRVGSWTSNNNGPYDALNTKLTHCSTTLAYNSGFVKLEYQIPYSKEGPIPLDISSYAYRYAPNNATGTAWYNDSTLFIDQVEVFDMANVAPALDPTIMRYNNNPMTNTYQGGTNHYVNPNVYPMTFWSGYNTQVGGLTFRMFNRGGGTLNLTKWAFEGVNGKHFVAPGTAAVAPYGNYVDSNVYFKPKDTGYLTEKIVLTTNDTTGTYKFPLRGTSWGGPIIQNNSFELPPVYWGADVTGTDPVKANIWKSLGSNVVPSYWSFSANGGNAGVSTQMDAEYINNGVGFHVNNGLITQGNQALWLQATTTAGNIGNRSCRQIVYGWQSGTKYHFRVRVNARVINDNQANFLLRLTDPEVSGNPAIVGAESIIAASDTINGSAALAPVDLINEFTHPYTLLEGDWTCNQQRRLYLELYTPFNDDDSTVLIDSVDIQAVVNGVKKWNLLD